LGRQHYGEKGFFAGLLSIIFGFYSPIIGYLLGGIGVYYGCKALTREQDFAFYSIVAGLAGIIIATLWVVLLMRI
jgi:uncharacterized membrane protein